MTTLHALHIARIDELEPDLVLHIATKQSCVLQVSSPRYFTRYDLLINGFDQETVDRLFADGEVELRPAIHAECDLRGTTRRDRILASAIDRASNRGEVIPRRVEGDSGPFEDKGQCSDFAHDSSSSDSRSCGYTPGPTFTVEIGVDTPPSAVAAAVQAVLDRRTVAPEVRSADDLGPVPLRHCELPCCNPGTDHSDDCDAGLDICADCQSYGAQDGV